MPTGGHCPRPTKIGWPSSQHAFRRRARTNSRSSPAPRLTAAETLPAPGPPSSWWPPSPRAPSCSGSARYPLPRCRWWTPGSPGRLPAWPGPPRVKPRWASTGSVSSVRSVAPSPSRWRGWPRCSPPTSSSPTILWRRGMPRDPRSPSMPTRSRRIKPDWPTRSPRCPSRPESRSPSSKPSKDCWSTPGATWPRCWATGTRRA